VSAYLVQQLGHKAYKASIKPFKTLTRFLNESTTLSLLEEDQQVRLADPHIMEYGSPEGEQITPSEPVLSGTHEPEGGKRADIEAVTDDDAGDAESEKSVNDTSAAAESRTDAEVGDEVDGPNLNQVLRKVDVAVFLPLPEIEFVCGDIFEFDWSNADVVYTASLLFSDLMLQRLMEQAERMKSGAFLISLRPLPCPHLCCTCDGFFRMSWQMAMVYIYRRV
jgi:hypothetical protein